MQKVSQSYACQLLKTKGLCNEQTTYNILINLIFILEYFVSNTVSTCIATKDAKRSPGYSNPNRSYNYLKGNQEKDSPSNMIDKRPPVFERTV